METTIHRPDRPQHYMVLRPIDKLIKIRLPGGQKLAESKQAIRLLESGRTLYDPVIYLPRRDVVAELILQSHQTTCPLKGIASYFAIQDGQQRHDRIAWTYPDPHDFATDIKGLVAFYPEQVIVEEHPQ